MSKNFLFKGWFCKCWLFSMTWLFSVQCIINVWSSLSKNSLVSCVFLNFGRLFNGFYRIKPWSLCQYLNFSDRFSWFEILSMTWLFSIQSIINIWNSLSKDSSVSWIFLNFWRLFNGFNRIKIRSLSQNLNFCCWFSWLKFFSMSWLFSVQGIINIRNSFSKNISFLLFILHMLRGLNSLHRFNPWSLSFLFFAHFICNIFELRKIDFFLAFIALSLRFLFIKINFSKDKIMLFFPLILNFIDLIHCFLLGSLSGEIAIFSWVKLSLKSLMEIIFFVFIISCKTLSAHIIFNIILN